MKKNSAEEVTSHSRQNQTIRKVVLKMKNLLPRT
jgi:hypothetical protein